MFDWLKKNFLMLGILAGGTLAIATPHPGAWLAGLRLPGDLALNPILIFTIFVCSGLQLTLGAFRQELRNIPAIAAALVIINLLFPVAAVALAKLFNITGQAFIGLLVVASAPPTLASGIIITGLAGGSIPLAILLTLAGNISAVLIMPIGLKTILAMTTDLRLDVLAMLVKLLYMIILPILIGQTIRRLIPDVVKRRQSSIAFVPSVAIVLIVFMIVSQGSATIRQQSGALAMVAFVCVILHLAILLASRLTGAALRLTTHAAKAIVFVASQKTLPVSILVLTQAFPDHPAAIVPAITFHILQILVDSLLASWWRQRGNTARPDNT